jgi:hypothetical protein
MDFIELQWIFQNSNRFFLIKRDAGQSCKTGHAENCLKKRQGSLAKTRSAEKCLARTRPAEKCLEETGPADL